jgi:hypothetical protein
MTVSSFKTGYDGVNFLAGNTAFMPIISRALVAGGENDGAVFRNTIDYFDITTTGNATDFGDLTAARYYPGAASSETRGVWAGGYIASYSNIIDYVTIASTGNAIDFGDLLQGVYAPGGCSNAHGGL